MDGVLAVAFPTDCGLCGGELSSHTGLRICQTCWASIEPWGGPLCRRCGLPFPSPRALDSSVAECGECRAGEPGFDGARSFGLYTGKLRLVVLRMKFAGDERLGARLGELLAPIWDSLPQFGEPVPRVIVPVPLHTSRRRERGFNQSELLAAGLARALERQSGGAAPRILPDCLRRKRATPPQTGLSVAARRENLRGAFEAPKPEEVRGRCIVLVDDVMTTGATLSACARALKHAGAAQVMGLTLARATPQFPDLAREDRDNTVDGLDWDST
ncbi:MAG: double zinc ribbon domain-containing protein [Terriglobia bacterium]